jgi:hypothetical protein
LVRACGDARQRVGARLDLAMGKRGNAGALVRLLAPRRKRPNKRLVRKPLWIAPASDRSRPTSGIERT